MEQRSMPSQNTGDFCSLSEAHFGEHHEQAENVRF
jgi:hypothetical protein